MKNILRYISDKLNGWISANTQVKKDGEGIEVLKAGKEKRTRKIS